eukprot:1835505-Rhodomonas_salina.1
MSLSKLPRDVASLVRRLPADHARDVMCVERQRLSAAHRHVRLAVRLELHPDGLGRVREGELRVGARRHRLGAAHVDGRLLLASTHRAHRLPVRRAVDCVAAVIVPRSSHIPPRTSR